ncbi:unnamed protein product [Polarella glacialis]|uniref:Uncharacterized protein n=1 Tax=Polarella glacialis TaxID=89957 RepID=A0A813IQH9_POLGL|nr:unnamed protein product [Polarella glacialis]
MACGGCICKCCGRFCIMLALFIGLLCIPAIETMYWQALEKYVAPDELTDTATPGSVTFIVLLMLGQLPQVPEYGPTFAEAFARNGRMANAVNAFEGPGLLLSMNAAGGYMLYRTSHEACKRMYYDRETDRVEDNFIGGIDINKAGKFFAPGVMPTLLQIGTSDPRWWARRDLWSATIPALGRHPVELPDFEFPSVQGLTEATFCGSISGFDEAWSGLLEYGDPSKLVPDELGYVVGFNFFRQAFGVDLNKDELDLVSELQSKIGEMLLPGGNSISDSFAARGIEIQRAIEAAVLKGEWSTRFLAEAEKRGMDGRARLRELLFSFIVAGYGAPGTAFYAMHVITYFKGKNRLALYAKDPEAFILEVVRLQGAGGANSFYHAKNTTKWTLGSGKVITEKAGSVAMTNLLVTGYDPAVWGGPAKDPAYAAEFIPGRDNRERVMSWMSELGDIRKCPNMTGCDAAPRFCPGAELTQRLTRQTADFYLKKCLGRAAKDEM